jgi:hypothetical protein
MFIPGTVHENELTLDTRILETSKQNDILFPNCHPMTTPRRRSLPSRLDLLPCMIFHGETPQVSIMEKVGLVR